MLNVVMAYIVTAADNMGCRTRSEPAGLALQCRGCSAVCLEARRFDTNHCSYRPLSNPPRTFIVMADIVVTAGPLSNPPRTVTVMTYIVMTTGPLSNPSRTVIVMIYIVMASFKSPYIVMACTVMASFESPI